MEALPWLEIRCARCKTPSDLNLAAMNHLPTSARSRQPAALPQMRQGRPASIRDSATIAWLPRHPRTEADRCAIESVFRLAARHRSFKVRSCECAGNLKTCWTKPPSAPVPLWKLDAASQRTAPSLRIRDMLDAVLMAKHSNRDMVSRTEIAATLAPGGLDVGSVTIGCLLSTLADRTNDDQ
jgi:hypothetical protein